MIADVALFTPKATRIGLWMRSHSGTTHNTERRSDQGFEQRRTEREGRLSKHDPVWGRISELHVQRFGR
jgi:hypothetical protein